MKPGTTMITLRMSVPEADIIRTRAKGLGMSVNVYCVGILTLDCIAAGVLPVGFPTPATVPAPT